MKQIGQHFYINDITLEKKYDTEILHSDACTADDIISEIGGQLDFNRISVSCVFWYEVNVCLVIYRLSFMTAEVCLSTVMLGHISLIQF